MVVAENRYLAEDAVERIVVTTSRCRPWSASPPPGAAEHLVHEDVPGNVAAHLVQQVGDAGCGHRRRAAPAGTGPDRSSDRRRCRWRAAVCWPAGTPTSQRLRIWTSTQTSTGVRAAVAAKLGLDLGQVEVITPGRRRRLRREDHASVAGGGAGAVRGPRRWAGRSSSPRTGASTSSPPPTSADSCSTSRSASTTRPDPRPGRAVLARQRRLHPVRADRAHHHLVPNCSGRTSCRTTGSISIPSTPTR